MKTTRMTTKMTGTALGSAGKRASWHYSFCISHFCAWRLLAKTLGQTDSSLIYGTHYGVIFRNLRSGSMQQQGEMLYCTN